MLRGTTTFVAPFDRKDVLSLSVDLEAGFLQRVDRTQMINARELRHSLSRHDFHLANFATRVRFAVKIEITPNRVFDVFQCFLHVRSLGVTPGQFGTTDRYASVVCEQGDVEFLLHEASVMSACKAVNDLASPTGPTTTDDLTQRRLMRLRKNGCRTPGRDGKAHRRSTM